MYLFALIVDIGGIVDQQSLNFLFIRYIVLCRIITNDKSYFLKYKLSITS